MTVEKSAIFKDFVFILLKNGKTFKVNRLKFPDSVFAIEGSKIKKITLNDKNECTSFELIK